MANHDRSLFEDLEARGLISQTTAATALQSHLTQSGRVVYCGFDPTADSLHIGHLVPLLMLKRFQLAGHKPLALIGGATGMIGDPSFKASERVLNTEQTVLSWVDKLTAQLARFIDFDESANSAVIVDNAQWMKQLDTLAFLRDVGKHFSVNAMIARESVKQRIDREGQGISFTEFSYMLLQSYDFSVLNQRYGCTLQIGGNDQWGNIVSGIDLTRRMHQNEVFGMTLPLITKSDGTKFGKTESGAIWLDPSRTSPYAFYQFWLNTADADVYRFLRFYTFMEIEQIAALEQQDKARAGRPLAQQVLAEQVTRLVHGDSGLEAAQRISRSLFSGDVKALTEADIQQLQQDGLPSTEVGEGAASMAMAEVLTQTGLATSNKRAREMISAGAITVNAEPCTDSEACLRLQSALFGRFYLLKRGKKQFHLLVRQPC
ncbi:MAG: tyrosine--tRNA ligase [Halopseudomonas sp.]